MNIELPKDAEGREIPLDTEVLYDKDGHPNDVSYFTYAPRSYSSGWSVVLVGGFERFASAMHLTPPDSWENAKILPRNVGTSTTPIDAPIVRLAKLAVAHIKMSVHLRTFSTASAS